MFVCRDQVVSAREETDCTAAMWITVDYTGDLTLSANFDGQSLANANSNARITIDFEFGRGTNTGRKIG